MAPRLCLLGFDCLAPKLVFERFRPHLPNFDRIISAGKANSLQSVAPPITIPAWPCMVTGRSPDELDIYGFNKRLDDRANFVLHNSLDISAPTIWEILSQKDKTSCILGVPLTYPAKPFKGTMLTGCLTPENHSGFATYPRELAATTESEFGSIQFDIPAFRYLGQEELKRSLFTRLRQHQRISLAWLKRHPWDFFMSVDIGTDRLHHIFWNELQEKDDSENTILQYYQLLDEFLGKIIENLKPDDNLLVISDHGAQKMKGSFSLNQWLYDAGYLVLRNPLSSDGLTHLGSDDIDWEKTQAWGKGGYVGRIYFNPSTATETENSALFKKIASELQKTFKELGIENSRIYSDQELYTHSTNAPDITLYVGDLSYRCSEKIMARAKLTSAVNDRGFDSANHHPDGICIGYGKKLESKMNTFGWKLQETHELIKEVILN